MSYRSILESFILPIGDLINRSKFVQYLKYWRQVDELSEKGIKDLQRANLEKLLLHANKSSSYYSQFKLEGNDPYEWLRSFPVLTKDILRNNSDELLTQSKKGLVKVSSSGSSGVTSSVYMNSDDLSSLRAGLIHWWEWSGYKMGDPLLQTGITPNRGVLKSVKDKLFKTIYINAFSHSEEQLHQIFKKINNSENYFISGYASSLNIIAEFAINNGYQVHLKGAISLGDKLFNHYKKNIKKAFKCEIYDTYGSAEGFLIGCQADSEYMYILSPQTLVEILDDDDNPVEDGVMGNIVVTRLDGFAMPLIRYKVGDLGIKLPRDRYPKDRRFNYPMLERIIGRDTDIVKTASGKFMVVHSFTGIFEYIPEIKQFKVIQKDLSGIQIEYIPSVGFEKRILDEIRDQIHKNLNDSTFNIEFKEVDLILPSKSGKPQIIESQL